MKNTFIGVIFLNFFSVMVLANEKVTVDQDMFIQKMVNEHAFDIQYMKQLFAEATVSKAILKAVSRPAERKLVWYEYRKLFIQDKRIQQGVEFWQTNYNTLQRAEKRFGVSAEIIVAIIGIETFYGRITGRYRVIDALNTLAFHYPKRADFFRSELEHFLLLTREQGFDPLRLTGSYAGAMGIPQFIASSYRHYAVDFDGDNVINLWESAADAIGSAAHYLQAHGWRAGVAVIDKATVKGDAYKTVLTPGLKLDLDASQLTAISVYSMSSYRRGEKLKLLSFEQLDGPEYWLARHNFYVITRYNHSELYAMAVYKLAREIKKRADWLAQKIE